MCWPGEDQGQPPTWPERKVQAAFSRAAITHGPCSRPGSCRILCAPEDSCVLQTPHYPRPGQQCPSSSVITQAHAQQHFQGQEITRLASPPFPSPPLPSPAFRPGGPTQSPAGNHSACGSPACLTVLSSPLILFSPAAACSRGTRKCGSPAGLSLLRRT